MAVSQVEMRERAIHEILALLQLPLRLDDLSTCKKISFYKLVWEENCVELKLKECVGVSGVQRCAERSSCAEGWLNSGPKGALVKRTINAGKSRKMGIHSTELNTALSVKYIDMSFKTQSVCTSHCIYSLLSHRVTFTIYSMFESFFWPALKSIQPNITRLKFRVCQGLAVKHVDEG